MLKLKVKDKQNNFYLEHNLIPLGRNTFFDRLKNGMPTASKYDIGEQKGIWQVCIPYKRNGVTAILGGSSVGKSVTGKKIFCWAKHPRYFGSKYKRPGIIFDYQGDDHRLIIHPNGYLGNNPFPLIKDIEKPVGFGNEHVINFTPLFLKEDCFFKDQFFGFKLSDFKYEDWYSLRIKEASLETLQELVSNNKKIASNPQEFYDEFKRISISKSDDDSSSLKVEENISEAEKRHLRKILRRLVDEEIITTKEYKKDFINLLFQNKILIFNFHEEEIFTPFYMSPIARKLYLWARDNTRKKGAGFLNPIFLLEEAQIPLDKADRNLDQGANKWITKYLKQGNKYQNWVILITQAITEVNKVVRDHAVKQEVILGNPVESDLKYFSNIWRSEVINVIKTLRWEERELALVHSSGNYVETFKSNNSMTQIHLR